MVIIDTECSRCAGSGTIGVRCSNLSYVAPGPVPEDARGIAEAKCDRCQGSGAIAVEPEVETCPECGLKADTLLHKFCTYRYCPTRPSTALSKPECFHDWKGPIVTIGNSASKSCSRCGMVAKDYYEAHPGSITDEGLSLSQANS